jgi:cell division protein FtsL
MTATAQQATHARTQATATAAATAPAPGRQPQEQLAPRPPLRVVSDAELNARARRRRARLLVALTSVLVVAALFGLAAAHVVLTQNQFRLEQLNRAADQQQLQYERLRRQVADLESPSRIVAAAQERMGMVPPASVKYLTPAKGATAPAPSAGASTSAQGKGATGTSATPAPTAASHEQAVDQWSAVKRHLDNRP